MELVLRSMFRRAAGLWQTVSFYCDRSPVKLSPDTPAAAAGAQLRHHGKRGVQTERRFGVIGRRWYEHTVNRNTRVVQLICSKPKNKCSHLDL